MSVGEGAGVAGGESADGCRAASSVCTGKGLTKAPWRNLLGTGFAVAEKDRLYRCLDRHRGAQGGAVRSSASSAGKSCSRRSFDVLLYDLTSTYIEGEGEEIPKAKHGYSRDQRFDCKQVVIALVVTPEGFPLAYEVMEGNTSDRTTLRGFLDKIEALREGAAGVGDGPWNSDRRGARGDAHLGPRDLLSGGNAAQ